MKLPALFAVLPVVQAYAIPVVQEHTIPVLEPVREDAVERRLQHEVSGMGVHFATSYAAVAVRYGDGRVEDFLRVPAGAEWIAAMARWADGESTKCVTAREKLRCGMEQGKRRWNAWLERRDMSDIATLSAFMKQVQQEIVAKLDSQSQPFTTLNVFPILPALQETDIQYALHSARLAGPSSPIFSETNAAYAGLGNGICPSWQDADQCTAEESAMQPETTLFLSFDTASFSATLQPISRADTPLPPPLRSTHDPTLGWDSLPVYEVARAKFWARIQDAVTDIVGGEELHRVVLTGEFGEDPEFWEVARAGLGDAWRDDWVVGPRGDVAVEGGMLAARGAAEIAGRSEFARRAGVGALEGVEDEEDEEEYEYEDGEEEEYEYEDEEEEAGEEAEEDVEEDVENLEL